MSTANGAGHSLAYVQESEYGVIPATPTLKALPHTGCSLALSKDKLESEKLRGDRIVSDVRHGNRSVGGDITSELEFTDFDDLLEAVMCGTWATNVLKTGLVRRSFTVERKFSDLATPEFHRYTGVEFNTFNLSVAPNQIVAATFGTVGKDQEAISTAALTGAVYNAEAGGSPFDSFSGTIQEGGNDIGVVTSIEMTLENGMEPLFAIGSKTTSRPSIGRSRVTGNITVYYENKAMYEKFINEESSDLVFTLVDLDGNSLEFKFPNVKYSSGQPDVQGEGAVTLGMDFDALYDGTEQSQLVIKRTPA